MGQQAGDLGIERFGLGEVHQANRAATDLVFVGGADAALGGADLRAAAGLFAMGVELPMQREDQRNVLGDFEIFRRNRDALGPNLLDFLGQMVGVDDDAIADDGEFALAHDARRQ